MNYRLRRLSVLILMIAAASPLLATTIQKMELPQLVSASDNIVQGRVESVEARQEGNRIYTYVSVTVDDPLKGERRRTVLVRQLGGAVGARRTWVAGMPEFQAGDQVIVFLKGQRDGTFGVTGLNQGKYNVVDDFAVANVSGVTIVDPKTGVMSEAGFVDRAPVETFKAKIRELAR